ncbi:DUF1152 protein [Fadolivirus algeromassiliense]|jgi:hypothetical protein|uniref:DUF1152 protein n=1 Tax=Fadolivirus FV1/VV64 TaxID=3070911 RepID=A0A7D3QW35_9VIRU|nr:DUF1152 protein [Fadolivirus algeromassiliense]QKF94804.1 DUF1152 protein [Fadolivirus FV1/VV64]
MFAKTNIVIFAAGGGNDVFSSIGYIKAHISKYKFDRIAIVSVLGLTPFHSNEPIKENYRNVEQPLIKPTKELHRYLPFHTPKEIYCMEKLIPELLEEFTPYVKNYVSMSPKYSAYEQSHNLRKLFNEWEMHPSDTLLNIVDFGGDILTNGLQSSIISPELDAYTLAVVQNLSEYTNKISVCFPGVDGELPKKYLSDCCENSLKQSINLNQWYDILNKIYDKLKDARQGNTIPNMIRVLDRLQNNNYNIECELHKKWVIGKKVYSHQTFIDIDIKLQENVHVFDMISYNPFVTVFNSTEYDLVKVIDHINKIYEMQEITDDTFQSSDFHLQYLRKDLDGKWTNRDILYNNTDNVNDNKQSVMFVNTIPYVIQKDKEKIVRDIESLKTFDLLYG